jgi:hypothetical protein
LEKTGIKPKNISKETFIEICETSESMADAASKLGLHFQIFKTYAQKYDCYLTNQQGKGIRKNIKERKVNLEDYKSRGAVKKRIIKEGILEYKCEKCGINEWEGKNYLYI